MLTLVPMVYHDQKGYVAPHFDCLVLSNAVIPFMIPSVSCDTGTGINSVT